MDTKEIIIPLLTLAISVLITSHIKDFISRKSSKKSSGYTKKIDTLAEVIKLCSDIKVFCHELEEHCNKAHDRKISLTELRCKSANVKKAILDCNGLIGYVQLYLGDEYHTIIWDRILRAISHSDLPIEQNEVNHLHYKKCLDLITTSLEELIIRGRKLV